MPLGHDLAAMAREHSGCEVWEQDFLKLDLPDTRFDGIFANAALFHVPVQELPRVHLDLCTDEQERHVLRCLDLGATVARDWPYPPGVDFVVLCDPDGNEFCIIGTPG